MQLFERIKSFLARSGISERKMAFALNLEQSQFNRYLNAKSQRNLWEYLPQILELYPQVNKYWLYFGEGEMLGEANPGPTEIEFLRQRVRDLEAHLSTAEECLTLYRRQALPPKEPEPVNWE